MKPNNSLHDQRTVTLIDSLEGLDRATADPKNVDALIEPPTFTISITQLMTATWGS